MKYLITGGYGFIGYSLAKHLYRIGHTVTIIDNLSTSSRKNGFDHTFIEADIATYDMLDRVVESSDRVIHLAAIVGMKNGFDYPYESLYQNTEGTKKIAELCLKHNKELFFASTSEIYGLNTLVPLAEDANRVIGATWDQRWGYAESKAISERSLILLNKKFGLKVKIGRLFNVAGPGQTGKYGMVIPRFVSAARDNSPIPVYGNGNQTRSFCHIEDAISGILTVIDHGNYGEVYNIGNPEEVSINELAKTVIKYAGSKSEIEYVSYDSAYPGYTEISRRVPDVTKLVSLGWEPRFDLIKIIKDILAYERMSE
jgi:UDP-glucose 4-epimerase